MEQNPYQTPAANLEDLSDAAPDNAEAIRKAHINHEASVRSVGLLYYFGMLGLGVFAVVMLLDFDVNNPGINLIFVALLSGLAWLYYWIGSGLRKLKKNVSIVAGIFALLGLLSFPVGTIINGYVLYLLFSEKGKTVFSEEYQQIVDATPHIKYRTPVIIWLFLALLIMAVVAAIAIPIITDPSAA